MVNERASVFLMFLFFTVFGVPLYAVSFAVSGKTTLSSGVMQAEGITKDDKMQCITAASTSMQFDAALSPDVKATASITYAASTFSQSIALDRAYIKARLPRFGNLSLRVSAGRMPLSWGHGVYFNAGDIIFGSAPLTGSGFDTNAYRSATAWMVWTQASFNSMFFAEAVVVPEITHFTQDANTDIVNVYNRKETSYGGRLVFQPQFKLLDSVEAGVLAGKSGEKAAFYAAVDGTAVELDYNICAAISCSNKSTVSAGKQIKDNFELSAALFWSASISGDIYDHTLSLRCETLCKPGQKTVQFFSLASFTFTDSISASLSLTSLLTDKLDVSTHVLSASVNWTPLQGFDLSVQGSIEPKSPGKFSSILVSFTYTY